MPNYTVLNLPVEGRYIIGRPEDYLELIRLKLGDDAYAYLKALIEESYLEGVEAGAAQCAEAEDAE